MTIDEAIQYVENLGTEEENKIDYDKDSPHTIIRRKNTVKDYRQLAEWLQELKEAKKFIRKLQNELLKGTSFYSTSFYEENKELMDKLTKGVEYLDD